MQLDVFIGKKFTFTYRSVCEYTCSIRNLDSKCGKQAFKRAFKVTNGNTLVKSITLYAKKGIPKTCILTRISTGLAQMKALYVQWSDSFCVTNVFYIFIFYKHKHVNMRNNSVNTRLTCIHVYANLKKWNTNMHPFDLRQHAN